jgi:ferredoxin like protein
MSRAAGAVGLSLDARLGLLRYEIDGERSHIDVVATRCVTCRARPCLTVCPAEVYRWVDDRVAVRYENCLECGACQVSCAEGGNGAITWRNPAGGFGVVFRHG